MNYPPPLPSLSPLSSLSPVGETARHKANEVHLLTKRGGLQDTLIKCALETEVSETLGSSVHTLAFCVAMYWHRSATFTNLLVKDVTYT